MEESRERRRFFVSLIATGLFLLIGLGGLAGAEDYKVGPEDVLDIVVWKEPNLTKVISVEDDGTLNLPLIGSLSVNGLTTKQIAAEMTKRLKEGGYLLEPKVDIFVKEYRSKKVLVFGEIKTPGLYVLNKTAIPLLELISMAGGLTLGAGDLLIVTRQITPGERQTASEEKQEEAGKEAAGESSEKVYKEEGLAKEDASAETLTVDLYRLFSQGDLTQNIKILPGDKLYFSPISKYKIYVMGEVKSPGAYDFRVGLTAMDAVKLAGGANEFGGQQIKIIRDTGEKRKKTIWVRLNKILKGDSKEDVELQSGDIVVVPKSFLF